MKKAVSVCVTILYYVVIFLLTLIPLAVRWALGIWVGVTFDEIVYHLTAPIEGTSSEIMNGFYLTCLIPAIAVTAIVLVVNAILRRRDAAKKIRRFVRYGALAVLVLVTGIAVYRFSSTYKMAVHVRHDLYYGWHGGADIRSSDAF